MNKAKDAGRFPAFLRGLAHSLSESLLFMSASRCVNKVGPLKPPHLVSFQRGRFRNRFDPQNYGKQKGVLCANIDEALTVAMLSNFRHGLCCKIPR